MKEFKERLVKNRDAKANIHVVHHQPSNRGKLAQSASILSKDATKSTQIDSHRWLEIMDEFANGIFNLEPPDGAPEDYLHSEQLPQELRKDITVALIDDGVNFMHEAVATKLDTGRNFPIGNASDPFHGSTTGHGTKMAYMIGRVCPMVKIYVCKLDVIRQAGEKASFTAESAADVSRANNPENWL
jgi:hypothetical protein